MKTKETYICEKCEEEFDSKYQCEEHEKTCGVTKKFLCDKCGKTIEYTTENQYADNFDHNYEKCHSINLGRPGYGSKLDGCDVEFNLCDDCLIELIESFTWEGKAKVHNSGVWQNSSDEDWIAVEKGERIWDELEKERTDWLGCPIDNNGEPDCAFCGYEVRKGNNCPVG